MKKKAALLTLLAAMVMAVPTTASAHSYSRGGDDYPLRYIAYAIHPIGVFLQDFVTRPLHKFVSGSDERAYWFGHEPRPNDKY